MSGTMERGHVTLTCDKQLDVPGELLFCDATFTLPGGSYLAARIAASKVEGWDYADDFDRDSRHGLDLCPDHA